MHLSLVYGDAGHAFGGGVLVLSCCKKLLIGDWMGHFLLVVLSLSTRCFHNHL